MSENDIMKISDTIIRIAHPQKLLLFGSGATGTMNRESDIVEDMEIATMIAERDPLGSRKGTMSLDEYRVLRVARGKKAVKIAEDKKFQEIETLQNNIKEAFENVKFGRVKSIRTIK